MFDGFKSLYQLISINSHRLFYHMNPTDKVTKNEHKISNKQLFHKYNPF